MVQSRTLHGPFFQGNSPLYPLHPVSEPFFKRMKTAPNQSYFSVNSSSDHLLKCYLPSSHRFYAPYEHDLKG